MTPYRERREKGHYDPQGKKPESTHSHHLAGLRTGTKLPEFMSKAKQKAK